MSSVLRLFKGRPVGLLGVDIGSASIKLVELSRQAHGCRVEAYGVVPLPPDVVVDGQFSPVGRLGEAIRELMRGCGCRSNRAALAMAGPSVVSKTLAVDAASSDADVEATIEVEADRHLPGPLDETAYDFEVQGLSPQDPKQAEAVLVACPKVQLSQATALLKAARLRPIVVETQALALARGLAEARTALAGDHQGPTALFDLMPGAARLRVFEHGQCIHRANLRFEFGGSPATNSAPAQLDGFRNLSELGHRATGSLSLSDSLPSAAGAEPVHPTINPVPLARAVAEALERFEASAARGPVGATLLAGEGLGGGSGKALLDAMDERLRERAAVANPFHRMSLGPRIDPAALFRDASGLLTACGLALWSVR